MLGHMVSHGESSLDKWPIIDSNKSEAYPGTIPMIKYEEGDECDLFGFDFEAEDERSWGGGAVEEDIPGTPNSASYSL